MEISVGRAYSWMVLGKGGGLIASLAGVLSCYNHL